MNQNNTNESASQKICDRNVSLLNRKQTSMATLIIWNISKALETNPLIDLKIAMKTVQRRLESNSRELNTIMSQYPEEKHLVCALLAWQELGHKDADSLCKFIETNRSECENMVSEKYKNEGRCSDKTIKTTNSRSKVSNYSGGANSGNFDTCSLIGPVIKLPLETKIVMRVENTPSVRQTKKQRGQDKDIMSKIDAACCIDNGCVERLAELDAATKELRKRAGRLAHREAERVELLERAEAAWKDLELGYQRRLSLAEEKEDDITKQIQKIIDERDSYKKVCTTLAIHLKERGETTEKDCVRLTQIEKEVCDRACVRLRLSEESARGDTTVAERQCKAAQLDRDLQEEQARRKLSNMENEVESARALTHEAERAMRSELAALREQITQVSNELLKEDAEYNQTKQELEELKQEKLDMVEDLEGCKVMCDNRMQDKVVELKKKREQLSQLKDKVTECRCKIPIDVTVEAKRTPSLAALCKCNPEDKLLESCSCTSLRSQLLSNLLADLFGGLQAELGGSGLQMPCQLLKCLEDKHNWNRTSVVKTNLRNFFAQLLIGELDVAIATSIENYHAKWVGASCADVSRVIPDPEEVENEGWQERALERKAQKLATKLAEQMFQERAEQLVQRAKDIVSSGPPPCECKPQSAVYSCFVKPPIVGGSGAGSGVTGVSTTAPPYWRKTFQDVTQLRAQIEDLKRETIKKADLKLMENNIAKMVHRSSVLEASSVAGSNKQVNNLENNKEQDIKYTGLANTDNISKYHLNSNKTTAIKKKQSDVIGSSKKINKNITGNIGKTGKTYKKNEQAYTVNVCFCDSQKYPSKTIKHHKPNCSMENECRLSRKDNTSKDIVSQMSSVRQTKPIYDIESTLTNNKKGKTSSEPSCRSNCVCFYKVPSNTSIDKLLETLTKWKYDLTNVSNQNTMPVLNNHKSKQISNNLNINIKTQESPIIIKSIKSDINSSISKGIEFEQYLPPTTESEYMGEINLDNDMFSGCNKKNNSFNKSSYRNKSQDKLNIPINCLSPETCNCKKCSEEKEIQKDQLTLCNNEEQTKMLQSKSQLSIEQTQKLQEQSDLISNTEDITTDMNENNKMKDLFPSNSQYYNIKFLGVTLANTNSQCILHDEYTLNVKNNKNILKNNETMNEVCYNNKDQSIKEEYRNINVDQRDEHLLACNCNIKFNEFKYFTGEKLSKQRVNFYENEKAVESQSFNDNVIIDKHEMCVCCNDNKFDNSRDLEVNTFHLLEEHLKNRLEEFRQSSCKSSCISLDEQEKIFSTIFQRVKQIISDSSNKIICKCLDEEPSLGSWNRAYCLLQEYLKTKIKRVGCCCVSFQNEEKFVPDVLDQVCHLIENDFERLKSLCKCKNTVNKSEENYLMTQNELPERDINNDSYNHYPLSKNLDTSSIVDQNYNTNKLSKLNSPIILAQNISAQVPSNLEMKTKSCDAMERKNKNVQITESHELLVNKYCNSSDICCHCNLPKNSRKPYSELFGTNEILVNHCIDIAKTKENCHISSDVINTKPLCYQIINEIESKNNYEIINSQEINDIDRSDKNEIISSSYQIKTTPDIGYTIDCTCNKTLGSCLCTKSMYIANNNQISNLYKKCDPAFPMNMSYIMDSVFNKNKSKHMIYDKDNNCMLKSADSIHEAKVNTYETMVSAHDDNEILLKDSVNKNICLSYHMVNTSHNLIENNNLNDEDQHELLQYDNVQNLRKVLDLSKNTHLGNIVKSETYLKNNPAKMLSTHFSSCDCDLVPICHVKMLVENIENKLISYNCTCNSMSSKVCPLHSKRILT